MRRFMGNFLRTTYQQAAGGSRQDAAIPDSTRLGNVEGYHVENFGCRASQADGDALAAELGHFGRTAAAARDAAVVVLNTCAVTAEAERKARAYLRRVKRENPAARVIVTGCYAQRAPDEVARLAGVNAVVGNSHKALVAQVAAYGVSFVPLTALAGRTSRVGEVPMLVDDRFAHANLAAQNLGASEDTRPNLKVQDGCGNRCSFCIIPTTRGASRSMPLKTALERVQGFVGAGGKELVLSGINLGRWGRDFERPSRVEELVAAILEQTALPRLRISSVEPMDWSADLLALYRQYGRDDAAPAGPRLARHAHLPLQSGSDAILRAMHRRYRPWHYAEKLAAIRDAMPDAAIGADVMVGFPGETDALFEESFAFIKTQPFTYLHLFPFSARPGTAVWALAKEKPVPTAAVRERIARIRALMRDKQTALGRRVNGKKLSVITLKGEDGHRQRNVTPVLSDNFLHMEIDGNFAANRMLWSVVCHRKIGETNGSAVGWRVIPMSEGSIWNPMLYSSSEGAPSTTLEESHSTR
jgi:threonylcarbamoyladenosine tRNA methylthiotransferase MtaB